MFHAAQLNVYCYLIYMHDLKYYKAPCQSSAAKLKCAHAAEHGNAFIHWLFLQQIVGEKVPRLLLLSQSRWPKQELRSYCL